MDSEIPNEKFNDGAKVSTDYRGVYEPIGDSYSKVPSEEDVVFTTGAIEMARKNNIYDMAGIVYEYTMEKVNICEAEEQTMCNSTTAWPGGSFMGNGKALEIANREWNAR